MDEICIVIPCYNEEHRLDSRAILEYVAGHGHASLCLVDDGSSDATAAKLEALQQQAPRAIAVLRLGKNSGKAEAVRRGVLDSAASGRFAFVGYWDADLSTPLGELDRMLEMLAAHPECGMVMGSRVRRMGAAIARRAPRHYVGRIFATWASLLLRLPVYDSQCGAKVMRADLAGVLFGEPFLTRWLFDVEILARLRNHLGETRVLDAVMEAPLARWAEVGGSKLGLSHMAAVPFDLIRISRHYNRAASKDPARVVTYQAPRA